MTDPWRYACPGCGSRHLHRRTRKGDYRCEPHGHVFSGSERVDLKRSGGTADA